MADDGMWYPPGSRVPGGTAAAEPIAPAAQFAPPDSAINRFTPPPTPTLTAKSVEVMDTPPADAPARDQRRRRRRLVWIISACLLLIVAAAAMYALSRGTDSGDRGAAAPATTAPTSDSTPSSISPTSSSPATTVPSVEPAAESELQAAAAAQGAVGALAVIATPAGPVGVTAMLDENELGSDGGLIHLWARQDGTWTETSTVSSPVPIGSWVISDQTGDGVNDLVIEAYGGNDVLGMVLSSHTGAWELVLFGLGDGTESEYVEVLRFEAGGLTSSLNPCVPSCATGGTIDMVWRYDPASDRFVS